MFYKMLMEFQTINIQSSSPVIREIARTYKKLLSKYNCYGDLIIKMVKGSLIQSFLKHIMTF